MTSLLGVAFRRSSGHFLIILCLAAFAVNLLQAATYGVFANPPIWVRDAIPAALSRIYFAPPPRYTAWTEVNQAYWVSPRVSPGGGAAVSAAIAAAKALDRDHVGSEYELLGSDDKGIVDFVELSFRLFGAGPASPAALYYLLLAVSLALFLVRYRWEAWPVVCATCLLIMMWRVVPSTVFNLQLQSPFGSRIVPILSLVACLHCLLFVLEERPSAGRIATFVGQILLIVFVIHIRTTGVWQLVAVGGLATLRLLAFGIGRVVGSGGSLRAVASLVAVACVAASVGGLALYRTVGFPKEFRQGQQITTRVVWHNIVSGFALHPGLASKYALHIDDMSILAAVERWLVATGRSAEWQEISNGVPDYKDIRWSVYDNAARAFFWHLVRDEPASVAQTFAWYKPLLTLDVVAWHFGLKETLASAEAFASDYFGPVVTDQMQSLGETMDATDTRPSPFSIASIAFLAAMVWAFRLRPATGSPGPTGTALGVLAAGSALPLFIGYPAAHNATELVVTVGALIQFALVVAAYSISFRWRRMTGAEDSPRLT